MQLVAEGDEFGPECALVERFGGAQLHGGLAPTGFAKGLQAITPTECDEEFSLPGVGQAVVQLDVRVVATKLERAAHEYTLGRAARASRSPSTVVPA